MREKVHQVVTNILGIVETMWRSEKYIWLSMNIYIISSFSWERFFLPQVCFLLFSFVSLCNLILLASLHHEPSRLLLSHQLQYLVWLLEYLVHFLRASSLVSHVLDMDISLDMDMVMIVLLSLVVVAEVGEAEVAHLEWLQLLLQLLLRSFPSSDSSYFSSCRSEGYYRKGYSQEPI